MHAPLTSKAARWRSAWCTSERSSSAIIFAACAASAAPAHSASSCARRSTPHSQQTCQLPLGGQPGPRVVVWKAPSKHGRMGSPHRQQQTPSRTWALMVWCSTQRCGTAALGPGLRPPIAGSRSSIARMICATRCGRPFCALWKLRTASSCLRLICRNQTERLGGGAGGGARWLAAWLTARRAELVRCHIERSLAVRMPSSRLARSRNALSRLSPREDNGHAVVVPPRPAVGWGGRVALRLGKRLVVVGPGRLEVGVCGRRRGVGKRVELVTPPAPPVSGAGGSAKTPRHLAGGIGGRREPRLPPRRLARALAAAPRRRSCALNQPGGVRGGTGR